MDCPGGEGVERVVLCVHVGVKRSKRGQLGVTIVVLELHRRPEPPVQTRDDVLVQDAGRNLDHFCSLLLFQMVDFRRSNLLSGFRVHEPIRDWDVQDFGDIPQPLREDQLKPSPRPVRSARRYAAPVVFFLHLQLRRALRREPLAEEREVEGVRVLHRFQKVVARRRRAVVGLEVLHQTLLEALLPEDRHVHADHLRAFLVHCRRVKVVDLLVKFRPHRVGQRARVFQELGLHDVPHLVDALGDVKKPHLRREHLVAEDGETLLQRELKPVTASHAVPRPVVEVLVGDDTLDPLEVCVCGCIPVRQDQLLVEDVQALVFHGPHVEVFHGDNVEDAQIVLEVEVVFVELHRPSQRVHAMLQKVGHCFLRIHSQRHLLLCRFATSGRT
mmetsp:Transcript_18676/g.46642  ORF Transcript_18676/g.46642 Transcript_18676/m.46642 type:complete len:386 (+) Transcript_18676:1437-2594(+)